MSKRSSWSLWLALFLFPLNAVQAAQYWLDSDALPIRDRFGACVRTGMDSAARQPGCDPMDRVILLPDAEGRVGAVLVRQDNQVQTLDRAYAAIHVGEQGQLTSDQASALEVNTRFGPLLEQQPPPPARFILRFRSGSASELTPESVAIIKQLSATLETRRRPKSVSSAILTVSDPGRTMTAFPWHGPEPWRQFSPTRGS